MLLSAWSNLAPWSQASHQHHSVCQTQRDHLFLVSLLEAKRPFKTLSPADFLSFVFSKHFITHARLIQSLGRGTRRLAWTSGSQIWHALGSAGELVKTGCWAPLPEISVWVWSEVWGFEFLLSSQVRLVLLVLRPHVENQWFGLIRIYLRGQHSSPGKCAATRRRGNTQTKGGFYQKGARGENCGGCYGVAKEQSGRAWEGVCPERQEESQNEVMSGVMEQRFRERVASAVSVAKRPGRRDWNVTIGLDNEVFIDLSKSSFILKTRHGNTYTKHKVIHISLSATDAKC